MASVERPEISRGVKAWAQVRLGRVWRNGGDGSQSDAATLTDCCDHNQVSDCHSRQIVFSGMPDLAKTDECYALTPSHRQQQLFLQRLFVMRGRWLINVPLLRLHALT